MIEIIISLLREYWPTISAGILALIIRLVEKLTMRKKLESRIKQEFPDQAENILRSLNGKHK